jgi:hypothetical protein
MRKKLKAFLFFRVIFNFHHHFIFENSFLPLSSNNKMSQNIEQLIQIVDKPSRKKRTPEEIAAANLEKDQKSQQREEKLLKKAEEAAVRRQKKEQYSTSLVPGVGIFAQAAMTVLGACKRNMLLTNLAFRRMIASRLIFPPKKNINKFATGGVAEECISQLFCDVGFACSNLSDDSTVIDLEISVPIHQGTTEEQVVPFKVSLKNSGKIANQLILENYRGNRRTEIRPLPPTFIIYTETDIKRVRIVYLDDEILRQGYSDLSEEEFQQEVYLNGDSTLTFRSGFLSRFIPRLPAEYILNADYPDDLDGLAEQSFSKLALAEVVRQLDSK